MMYLTVTHEKKNEKKEREEGSNAIKKVVHAHKFRKKNLEIIMTHRFRNPRPQKEDTYTNSGNFW